MTTKRKGFDADEVHVPSSNESRPRPDELVDILELSKKWRPIRPIGQIFPYGIHWVTTTKRDGGKGSFPTPCVAFDPETGERDSTKHCPWCEYMENHKGTKENPSLVRFTTDYWMNVIDRRAQEDAPSKRPRLEPEEKESGFKSKDSDSWTPVRAHRLNGQDLRKMRSLRDLNTHKIKGKTETMSVFSPEYGRDVNVVYDKEDKVPTNRFKVNLGDHTPLTEEEANYLIWDLSSLSDIPSEAEANAEYSRWAKRMKVDGDGEDEDEDKPKRKSRSEALNDKKKASNAALRNALDDDDEDEDDDPPVKKGRKPVVDDDEDEDDDPPVKKGKPAPKGKKPVVEDDDDDDEDEDDDPPVKKGKPAPKGKKPVIDDDDDEDEDEDDEPPSKKGKPAPKGKKPVVDDDEDEDDEDDEPPSKKGKAPAKGKKPVVDDDEDEDEDDDPPPKKAKAAVKGKKPVVVDDDEDEDEDDEPPSKKAKTAGKKPVAKGKKSVVDDDDEDF